MSRQLKLIKMTAHPILSKLFKNLTKEDLELVTEFVTSRENLSDDQFMFEANRWLLDKPKPKRFTDMWAIVTQCK